MVALGMSVEVCSYRLTLKGKPVGTHVLKTLQQGRITQLEARVQYQGALGQSTITQRSRCHAARHFSLQFREETVERTGQRTFDVVFDADSGLVTATRGPRDQASMAYLRPYRDPLSLLLDVRACGDEEQLRVPMLGKDVTVQRVGEVEVDTPLGGRRAAAYLLHPGGSAIYVDLQPPHVLLKMTQRLDDGYVEALLVRVAQEAEMESWGDESASTRRKKRSRRRRPRRGKRRS